MSAPSASIKAKATSRVASTLLAAWIFALSLAGVSPALHDRLHADSVCAHACSPSAEDAPLEDSDADGHYCGVIALQSALAIIVKLDLPERSAYQQIHFPWLNEQLFKQISELRLHARAPPVEI